MSGNVFDDSSAKRIVRAVKHVERGIQGSTHNEPRRTPQIIGGTLVAFTLTEDMGTTTSGEASCTVHRVWSSADETYTTGTEEGVVVDPFDIFDEAVDEANGKGYLRAGDGRQVIDPIVISC